MTDRSRIRNGAICRRRTARRSAVGAGRAAIAAGLVAVAFGAAAADLSIRSTVGERLQFDDNIRLLPDSPGWVVGSTTSVDVNAKSKAETYEIGLSLGADYNTFAGPGRSGLDSLDWDAQASAERRIEKTLAGIKAGYREQAARESELEDTGRTQGDVTRETASVGLNVSHEVTSRDQLGAVANLRDVSFDGDEASGQRNPYVVVDTALSWSRTVTPTESLAVKLSATVFDSDDPANTESQAYSVGASYEVRQTPTLTLRSGGGVGVVVQERDVAAVSGGTSRDRDTSPALDLDIGIRYTLERVEFDASFVQGIEPSARGVLQQHRTVQVGVDYEINSELTLNLTGLYRVQSASVELTPVGDSDRTFASFEPRLIWNFARDWNLATGYRFRVADDNEDVATSNAVYVSLTYAFTILP